MKIKWFRIIVLLSGLLIQASNVNGQSTNSEIFTSPNGLFRIKNPHFSFGEKIQVKEHPGLYEVQFLNDAGSLLSIIVITDSRLCPIDVKSLQSSLTKCSRQILLNAYLKVSKSARILKSTFLNDIQGGLAIDEVVIPGGSTIEQTRTDGTAKRLDSIRIAAAFQKSGTIILSQYDPGFPPGFLDVGQKKYPGVLEITSKDRQTFLDLLSSLQLGNG